MSSINSLIIKERRKALGLSQEALANKLGVSKVAICWYETGERTPTMENFLKLSDILGLSLDQLTGREVNVVAEEEEEYNVKLPKKDLEIIGEIKKYKDLYKNLYNDPVRITKLIDKRMK
ncbi:MAG: helix-turn-helix transcriptional regulator [Bacilli bacterium]|nr:helix-turn-helix transcriptional regulator [Bacilli bacterium]